ADRGLRLVEGSLGRTVRGGGLRRRLRVLFGHLEIPACRVSELDAWYPVEPKPPSPRALSGSSSTAMNRARVTGITMSWAIRSPTATSYALLLSVLSRLTLISPR